MKQKHLESRDQASALKRTSHRGSMVSHWATVPTKFARVFSKTAHYLRKADAAEKAHGKIDTPTIQKMVLDWAKEILGIIGLDIDILGNPADAKTPVLFVGNHVSYLDIPLLMASVPVVFVSKEEVSRWLVIGPASKKAGTVFVKRESGASRLRTAQAIADCILVKKRSLAIFPSGTTSIDESKPWKKGVFNIAAKNQIPVQPFRVTYIPLRKAAYIERDTFAPHLWSLLSMRKPLHAVLEFGPVQMITDPEEDCKRIQAWCQGAHTLRSEV